MKHISFEPLLTNADLLDIIERCSGELATAPKRDRRRSSDLKWVLLECKMRYAERELQKRRDPAYVAALGRYWEKAGHPDHGIEVFRG
jgi:hypothetical protein